MAKICEGSQSHVQIEFTVLKALIVLKEWY